MLKLSLIHCFDTISQFKVIMPLELRQGGITEPVISKMDFGAPYELKLKINVNSPAWQLLKDSKDYGIRLTTQYVDLAFVLFDRKQVLNGIQQFTFMSSSFKLKFSQPALHDLIYNGSGNLLISRLDPDFVFTLTTKDRNINLPVGLKNNLENLKEFCDKAGTWTWMDGGIVEISPGIFKTEIFFGELNSIGESRQSSDKRFTPVKARQKSLLDNFFNINDAIINWVHENDSGEEFSHLLAIGDVGQGASLNSKIEFNENDLSAEYIDAEYPLVLIFNPVTQKKEVYIYNSKTSLGHNAFVTETFKLVGNARTDDLTDIITEQDAKKNIYNQGVSFIKSKSIKRKITTDVVLKRICLPGTICDFRYKEVIKKMDGRKYVVFDIDNKYPMRDIDFDLNKVSN